MTPLQKAINEAEAYCKGLMSEGAVNPHAIAMGTKLINIMKENLQEKSVAETVKGIISDHTGTAPEYIHLDSTNNDMGIDSLCKVDIVVALEDDFAININDSEMDELKCFADYVKLVEGKVSHR